MRILLALALMALPLAGCIAEEPELPETQQSGPKLAEQPSGKSHPVYSYPVSEDLPTATEITPLPKPVQGDPNMTLSEPIVWMNPPYRALPEVPTGLQQVAGVAGVGTSGGISLFGPLGFIGGRGQGPLYVVDLSDPENPVLAGTAEGVPVRDADTIMYPSGQLVVITTAGGRNQFATDVTNPYAPVLLSSPETDHGNHNIAVVPGTPIVYNSGSGGQIDIMNYTDPQNPISEGTFPGGCHDITFYINAAENKSRAYCAGYANTYIWDISDPLNPKTLVTIPFPGMVAGVPVVGNTVGEAAGQTGPVHPSSFSHLAMVNHDATALIVGDETGGGGSNFCDVYTEVEGRSISGPTGNLWFYDLSSETDPQLRGHVSPGATDADGSCTAHFGELLEDTGFLAMGFYSAGVVLVDFRDISNPLITDRFDEGGNVWDVQYHSGRLYSGDMTRGMDVLLPTG